MSRHSASKSFNEAFDHENLAIYGTRPWHIYGEGKDVQEEGPPIAGNGEIKHNKMKAMTAEDIRFTTKGDVLYAFDLGNTDKDFLIKALGTHAKKVKPIKSITLLGSESPVNWTQTADKLNIIPDSNPVSDYTLAYKIEF